MPEIRVVNRGRIVAGSDPSIYAFNQREFNGNLLVLLGHKKTF